MPRQVDITSRANGIILNDYRVSEDIRFLIGPWLLFCFKSS